MRISSQMQNTSYINMQSSEIYKNHLKKVEDEDNSIDTEDTKHVTPNIVVEKKDDLYVLSEVDEEDNKTVLSEVKANTTFGLELSNYFKTDASSDFNNTINQVNESIKSMSLADYI